jgi:hypothetical protein
MNTEFENFVQETIAREKKEMAELGYEVGKTITTPIGDGEIVSIITDGNQSRTQIKINGKLTGFSWKSIRQAIEKGQSVIK